MYFLQYFFLPLPGERLQVCRKLSFPGCVPKCSYAISLRISPRCPIQKFYYFLRNKKNMKIIIRKPLIFNQSYINAKPMWIAPSTTLPGTGFCVGWCQLVSSCGFIKSHGFWDVKHPQLPQSFFSSLPLVFPWGHIQLKTSCPSPYKKVP